MSHGAKTKGTYKAKVSHKGHSHRPGTARHRHPGKGAVKRGRATLVATRFQTGTSKTAADKKRKALLPGKRRAASGRIYYERRKNRSDTRGSRT